jgi:spoIIIJ-associated protein
MTETAETTSASQHPESPQPADEVATLSADELLVQEGDIAADYLERLLDIVDYDGDIDLDVENGRAMVAIVGSQLQPLVGPAGATLDALQELTRLAVQQQTGVRSRLMLDVSGHRKSRRDELSALAREAAQQVLSTGEPNRLAPMNPFERKVVHDVVSATDGVISESEGEEPNRRVVILPAP